MPSPVDSLDSTDPGDETIRNFEYQAAYGVILLIGAATGSTDHRAIWCEQREDLLGEVTDQLFDAYQVKTRQPENGAWRVGDERFWKSVGRFVDHDTAFPQCFRAFHFVSNAEFLETDETGKAHFCVPPLLAELDAGHGWSTLSGPRRKAFDRLCKNCGESEDAICTVLQRLVLLRGPDRNDFRDVLSQSHAATVPECAQLPARALAEVVDALISLILKASAKPGRSGSRHYVALQDNSANNPYRLEKRVEPADLILAIRHRQNARFQYLADLTTLDKQAPDTMRLQKKLIRGGLADHFEILRRQMLSAQEHLLDLVTRQSGNQHVLSQLENVVLNECQKAKLRAQQTGEPFGPRMLIDVQDRLRDASREEPGHVYRQHEDLLLGIAAALTGLCQVWWSNEFDLGSTP